MPMKNFFTVLGGMGTLATESFIHILNERTPIHSDQDYLNYLLVNHATVPDRTDFILGKSKEDPSSAIKEDIQQYAALNPEFFVLTCNTAHHFFDELQQATDIPILHMPRLAVEVANQKFAKKSGKTRVGLLATEGTIQTKVYENELEKFDNLEVILPSKTLQQDVTNLIYRDVKENHFCNEELFYQILQQMSEEFSCDVMVLGCTELSLVQEATQNKKYPVVDAQSELANETIRRALKNRI
ncbi:aspartate racemase [Tetragenococcus koreensis]|uniref:Aspartate racemase n=2 Tax=Tetragenococcus koreensis TaxID=290335 RepID=A0AAN4UA25_9ENTE|nr:aspartate racemase [Tetragenococcus koreensis]GEQ48207.1 aspartate racemase [Tetragenococcus koreensis]GEQ50724.1 aspartate racemase [Tetragenococcus koreensis]GEQ53215.1 aspartate racemase [Tetragenococcus koreensis]GEQ55725.1 aspartate racemase [Tetragenococcus koreensis]